MKQRHVAISGFVIAATLMLATISAWACGATFQPVTVNPPQSFAGSTVTVQLSGYTTGQTDIRWNSADGPILATMTGNASGFPSSAQVVIPGSATPGTYTILATQGSSSPGRTSFTVETQSAHLVRHAYLDLLWRAADDQGLTFWSGAIDRGAPRSAIADSFTASTEYRQKQVRTLYLHYMLRPPTPVELDAVVKYIAGGATYEQVIAGLTSFDEYFNEPEPDRAHGDLTAFVRTVYRDVLGREADAGGLNYWVGRLSGGSPRAAVADAFSSSPEYYRALAGSSYANLLHRPADGNGLTFWVQAFEAGTRDEAMVANFVGSDEYWSYS